MGFEPTSSLLKRQVRQPLRYASACKNHSASAPHGCRTRLITIKSRVHDRSANGAKFYDSAFVSVFVSSSLSSLLSLYNCSNRDRTSGFLRNLFGFSSKTLSHPLRGVVERPVSVLPSAARGGVHPIKNGSLFLFRLPQKILCCCSHHIPFMFASSIHIPGHIPGVIWRYY